MKKIILISGGYDPIHSGHIAYIQAAKKLGDILVVAVNSDEWLVRKKGRSFMPLHERLAILNSIQGVDFVIGFNDSDNSACDAINMTRQSYPADMIIFANGGDRTKENIPEMSIVDDNLEFAFGVGGDNKMNSSSWILEEWKAPKTQRQWGYYRVLHEVAGTKVKELTVMPGKSLSMQRHFKRAEHWHVSEGRCVVDFGDGEQARELHEFQHIPVGQWHRLYNPFEMPCRVVEIQYGNDCDEDDIERRE
jgi:cytidyltransferase-like protein